MPPLEIMRRRFFFLAKIARASSLKLGAMITSVKISLICSARSDDAAEGRLAVGRVGLVPGGEQRVGTGDAARVGVLEDGDGRALELVDQVSGRGDVQNVVIAELLALELLEALVEGAVEGGLLVRIFAVAQRLRLLIGERERLGETDLGGGVGDLAFEVAGDGGVVAGGALENLQGELAAQRVHLGLVAHGLEHGVVVGGIADDGHALVVLRRAAQHRRAADVDILDGLFEGDALLGDGLLKRVQVDDHQVDHRDAVGTRLGEMGFLVATAQQAAVDFRMQGLHAALHDLGETRVLAHLGDRQAFFGQKFGGAARGKDAVAVLLDQGRGKFHEPAFVAHRKKGQFFHRKVRFCAGPEPAASPKPCQPLRPRGQRVQRALAPDTIRGLFVPCLARRKKSKASRPTSINFAIILAAPTFLRANPTRSFITSPFRTPPIAWSPCSAANG